MKKVSIILLAVIVAAALMMIPVFATTGGVAASEVAGIVGKTTDIYISVHGFADVESLAVEYQIPEGLTLESASWIPKGNLQDVNLESRRAVWTTKNPLDMIQSTQVLKMTVRVENSALDPQDLTKTIALRVMVDSASQGRKEFSLQANVRILVPAQAVTLDQQMLYMDLVKAPQATLVATVSPDYTTDTLRWSSDNEDVVRVENGELTAIGVGIANITVTAGDVSAVCQVTVTCSHTGGTATCTQKAECEYCHETYGQYGAHTQEPHWVQYQETHVQVYGCCNALASEEELHQWDDGACSGCGATCLHEGGQATCTEKAKCDKCDEYYGQFNDVHTGQAEWVQTATKHSKIYGCCGMVEVEEAPHNWSGDTCLDCAYVCQHTGGKATCTEQATCTICGERYGNLDADNHVGQAKWMMNAEKHSQVYDCCSYVSVEEAGHRWEDGICADCNFGCSHAGSEATCVKPAVCTTCGKEHAQIDPNNHKQTEIRGQKPGGCLEDGYTGDVYCLDCEKMIGEGQTIPAVGHHEDADGQWERDKDAHFYTCVCGEVFDRASHTGGKATCTQAAICEECGASYGDLDTEGHIGGEATCSEAAICEKCGEHYGELNAANHIGGKATCTSKAICTGCGVSYGKIDPHNHTGATKWIKTETKHSQIFDCCGLELVKATNHIWKEGICVKCLYRCQHTGGEATCVDQAVCTLCDMAYGDVNAENHTGEAQWALSETKHSQTYDCCGLEVVKEAAHTWEVGICTICQYTCQHTGGEATCVDQAVCTLCDMAYGDVNAENHTGEAQWTLSETMHSLAYPCCGLEVVKETTHVWKDSVCVSCQYACQHTGGEATCNQKAICDICAATYGDLNAENHTEEAVWVQTATQHSKVYPCCDREAEAAALHTWKDGGCQNCGYACQHDQETELRGAYAETCYMPGYSGDVYCKICGHLVESGKEIPANEKHVASTAWFHNDTHHWHICTVAGCEAIVAQTEHSFQWVVDQMPTEMNVGWKHEMCTDCGYEKEKVEIPVVTHQHTNVVHHAAQEATCVASGNLSYYTCESAYCAGKYYADEACVLELETIVVPADPDRHVGQSQLQGALEATCGKDGYSGDLYCLSCNGVISQGVVIPATGLHTAGQTYQTSASHHWLSCIDCGAALESQAHTLSWIVDQNPTEDELGKKHALCAVCGFEDEAVSIDKIPHIPAFELGQKATCTEDGVADHYFCENCGRYFASENGGIGAQIQEEQLVVKATGHQYGETWQSDENGHWLVCHCGHKDQSNAHNGVLVGAVEATKEHDGYTGDLVCDICGYEMQKGQRIPSQAQNKVDEILAAQPGDLVNVGLVNEAGQVDTQILGQVLQAAAGKDVTLMLDAGDYQWTISGLQISAAELHTVDLKVQTNTQNIPADTVESLAGTAPTIQFAVGRMEAFGFLANLMTRVDAQYANAQYSLYAYGADGKLVQVQAGKIDADGNLTASLSSGGDYLLVIDLDSPPTGDNGIGLILACMACAMAVVVIIKAKKRLF